jgi:hypothetical protein
VVHLVNPFCTFVLTDKYIHTLYYYFLLSHPKLTPFWSIPD